MVYWGEHLDEVQLDEPDSDVEEEWDHRSDPEIEVADDTDNEGDEELVDAQKTNGAETKRKAQRTIFDEFAAQQNKTIDKEEVKRAIQETDDVKLSVRQILQNQTSGTIIASPRDYQTELFLKAKEENIIAVLDTGSGKTHIATMLLRHILDEELTARAKGEPHKVAFFLVDSVSLVFQQAHVLHCGLEQNVNSICGAMGASLWQKPTWDKLLSENMVIVCTAQVLVECMMHSFIRMNQVNILIFDEAHHAKGHHPYARLMREYYINEPNPAKRPRIFGMTASPVDANIDVKQATRDLEDLLFCKIATASDLSLIQNNISRPKEKADNYNALVPFFETPFYQELKSRYGDLGPFDKLFKDSKRISSELGAWASDMYWTFAFSEEEARKTEARQQRLFNTEKHDSVSKMDAEIAQLREAAEFVGNHDFGKPSLTLKDLSSKVIALHKNWLDLYYERTSDARCLVFVERRATARLLKLIFTELGGPNLHCDLLVGNNSVIGDQRISLRTQMMTLSKFRRGEINCLFVTNVAEEGLDIPQCNLVVRFDLYRTMIGYVQSRGRARHRNSVYVHMLEIGNPEHLSLVRRAHLAEGVMRSFCDNLPKDRIINEADEVIQQLLEDETSSSTYVDPSTGARLTFRSSLSVLAHFAACLPTPNQEGPSQPTYVIDRYGDRFLCEVILPECSPVISMRGKPQSRKILAKCSAAFEMCLELRQKDLIDENLLSTYVKKVSEMRNARLAITSKKKNLYKMRVKPEFWDFGYGTIPDELYLTVLDVSDGLDRPHQPLGLLTRKILPRFPYFPIYRNEGQPTDVKSFSLRAPMPVTPEILQVFNTLTLQVYRHIFAKKYESDVSKMTYWMVPLRTDMVKSMSERTEPQSLIDWDQVKDVEKDERFHWTSSMTSEFLQDRYLVDPHDGGRRFYSLGIRPDLSPLDPVPTTAPKHKWDKNILEYSVSLWKKGRGPYIEKLDPKQPVVEAKKIPFRRNLLAPVENEEVEIRLKDSAFLCPQATVISTLSSNFVAMCYVFPAIIHRLDSYLIALDACAVLRLPISPGLALEALTKDSEGTEEEMEADIKRNFKSGMGPNYERLEFMGDCFLKMATTIATYVRHPDDSESDLHDLRMVMLCNANLFQAAMKYELHEYVRTMAFSRRTWYPEGLKLTWGKGANRTGPQEIKHSLGDKSVADVCEAMIGATFTEFNTPACWASKTWDQVVKAVKLLVDSEDHPMEKFSDYYQAYVKPEYQVAEATASHIDLAQKIESRHPYHFKFPRLLRSAFIHSSQAFMWERIPNYQRLEFLGDALLDQVFIMDIFYRFPDKGPHWLTEHKMPMVSNRFLGAICLELGFHRHIRHNQADLTAKINDYAEELEQARQEARGKHDYWAFWMHVSEPPKCLADVVEAYVGAMFVDSEFDFTVVQNFYNMHIKKYFANMSLYDDFAGNMPFNRLAKLLQVNFGCREYKTASRDQEEIIPGKRRVISMVQIHFEVAFFALGDSARYAMPRACKIALEKLDGMPPYEFRETYGCTCQDEVSKVADALNGVKIVIEDGVELNGTQTNEND